ncbi:MAG TPA: HEAT repeat domain-containing protein, partial [Oligoflexia bacterium]|nr:HEAT repeat domain-containing protein [Oligoflexia bacterium]
SGTCAHGVSSPRGASASRQRSSSTQRRVNLLIKQLKHNDAAVRTNAATDLGAIGPGAHDAIEPLAQAARDDSSKWVRRAAVKSLPRISSGPRVVDVLAAACNDKDRWVAQSAEKVLRRMRSKPAPKASPLTRE